MGKKKILNDPIYGFISFPYEILYDLIDHPYFQRLRRISQMGLSHYVYPGALHTRFHHTLGALHLTHSAIEVLREKGVKITYEEAEAVCIAILLHDIGHGPFSHALEGLILDLSHEDLSLAYMEVLNVEFNGRLDLAIKIFTNKHPKKFLYQLISGQLDMDRMDYLKRDSFYTGVAEGVIGHDRIIKMLNVHNNELVVEEKGIYSIEKFLVARRLMYWQVYLHKTSIAAEQMLIHFMKLLKQAGENEIECIPNALKQFIKNQTNKKALYLDKNKILSLHSELDDHDIYNVLKNAQTSNNFILAYLGKSLLHRKLFKIELQEQVFKQEKINEIIHSTSELLKISREEANFLVLQGKESNQAYKTGNQEIKILKKDGSIQSLSDSFAKSFIAHKTTKYYVCYPRWAPFKG